MRCRLISVDGTDAHLLILNVHHVAIDGASTGILFNEVSGFYQKYVSCREIFLLCSVQRHLPIRADTDPPTATPASETCHWHSVAAQPLLQGMFGEAHQYGTWAILVTRKRMKDSLDFRRFPPRACIRERIDYCLGNLIFSGDLGSQKNQLLVLEPSR